ncbi:hypothetical protein ACWCPM_13305, partial [Streptomyces sp. NPDC002309]
RGEGSGAPAGGTLRGEGSGAPAGGTPRGEGSGAPARLTPQRWRIARGVADGAANREAARSLSVSTRTVTTVDHHLRDVHVALAVRPRPARVVERAEKSGARL